MIIPTELKRTAARDLEITWSDDTTTCYSAAELRNVCPCATCREKRQGEDAPTSDTSIKSLPVISAAEAQPMEVTGMKPVGNYAYNIAFSDGHDSGIFTFDFLRTLGDE